MAALPAYIGACQAIVAAAQDPEYMGRAWCQVGAADGGRITPPTTHCAPLTMHCSLLTTSSASEMYRLLSFPTTALTMSAYL